MDNYNNKFRLDSDFQSSPLEMQQFLLHQIGDLYCEEDTFIDAHRQEVFELSFVDSGFGVFYTDEVPTEVRQGDIYFSFPGDSHKIRSEKSDTLRYFYIALEVRSHSNLLPILDFFWQTFHDPERRVHNAPQIFPYIRTVLAEFSDSKKYFMDLIEANVIQMLVLLYRSCNRDFASSVFYNIDTKKQMISNVVRYIDNNILSIYRIGEIAEKFSFDRSYLSKLFKSVMGVSMQEYLRKKKLEKAKVLLINEQKTITQTSELLHYSSIHNFSRAFKDFYHLSPQQYIYAVSRKNTIE